MLPGMNVPNVREASVASIWYESAAFNRYRGEQWMKEPGCNCPKRAEDFGGCRCQAYLLTEDGANADPVCNRSAHHPLINRAIAQAQRTDHPAPDHSGQPTLIFRDQRGLAG